MKRLLFIPFLLLSIIACKEAEFSPEGPTDVRVKNTSAFNMTEVTVNTSGGTHNFSAVNKGESSAYLRFDKAFPKAEVSAVINGQTFTTGLVDYNGMTYIGQAKITYVVYIKNMNSRTLEISEVIPDAPLD
jgi:hypothetical protein